MAKGRSAQRKPNGDTLSELDKFLSKFVELSVQVPKGMLAQSTDPDEKELILAYARPLNEQIVQLSDYIRKKAGNASPKALDEIATILRVTAANTLAESGLRVARNISSQKAKIAISDIIKLIKKILEQLVNIFHINLPEWFWPLIELIDEILDFLLSIGLIRLASTLSKRHQDYMSELTHLKRLQRESALSNNHADEEEEE